MSRRQNKKQENGMSDANVIQFPQKKHPRKGNPPREAVECMKAAGVMLEQVHDLIDRANSLCLEAGVYPPGWQVRERPKPFRA